MTHRKKHTLKISVKGGQLLAEAGACGEPNAENRAKDWVCEARLSLAAAQRGFAFDWRTLYRRLFGHAPTG